ncbi:MAG: cell division protein FtsQ [Alteromonadaceae bacterium]|jgi:cell division protein FtsQ
MTISLRGLINNCNWPLIGGMSFFLLVVILLINGYQRTVEWLMDEKEVPLRYVVVSGELHHTSAEVIQAAVLKPTLGSFFNVDVSDVQKNIEALPWVYRASVRKQWPDVLTVFVTEQQSVAIWNEQLLLNSKGDIFNAKVTEALQSLPKLKGPQGSQMDALQGYRDLSSLLSINGFGVDTLTLSARFSWQIALNNGVMLQLGRDEKVKRVQRFIDLYSVITAHKPQPVISVDLRYDTGMAVRWADSSTAVKQGEKNS